MPMTPEQKAANEQLEEAVKAILSAYPTILGEDTILVDYTLIAEGMRFTEDGTSLTQVGLAYRGGDCRATIVLGQLQLAADIVMDSFGVPGEEE